MKKFFLLTSFMVMTFTGALFATVGTEPTLSRVNASPFVGQIQEYNNAGVSGIFDPTFGTNGSLNIDSLLSGGQARSMQVLPQGDFLTVVSKTGSASQVGMYNAQGTLLASIALGVAATSQSALDSMIDRQGRLLVCGGTTSGTAGWIYRVNTTLTSAPAFTTNFAWQYVNGLAEQSTGNIIAVGFNGAGLYGQIGRYKLDGTIDTTFGTAGFVTLNGSGNLPIVTTGLASVTVDGQDRIYVAFTPSVTRNGFASGSGYIARFTPSGAFDTSFGSASGIVALGIAFDTATTGFEVVQDVNGNLIIASNVTEGESTQIVVAAMTTSGSVLGGFTTFDSSSLGVFNSFLFEDLITTQDGSILIGGTCQIPEGPNLVVIKLVGTTGLLDTTFNSSYSSYGYNLFYNGSVVPDTQAIVASIALAPDGRLYTADFQINSGVTTSYISRLYNTPYDSQVLQSPEIAEQGVFDTTFGSAAVSPNLQSFRGVTMPYNGNFGQSLQQQTRGIVELSSGDFLLGSDGYVNSTATKTMMLTWLTSAGILDAGFGTSSSGNLTLANISSTNEIMAALTVGGSGIIYVAGTNGTPEPFIRSYSSGSTTVWTAGNAITSLNDTGIASVGIAIQGGAGILLFAQDSDNAGHISRYISSEGVLTLDTANFGSFGKILTYYYGLNMGPVYGGGLVNRAEDIIISYVNSDNGYVNVAMINKNGSGLVSEFGSGGVVYPFGDAYLSASSVRIAFDSNIDENIYVAAVSNDGTQYLITRLDGVTGAVDPTFNNGYILSISPESVVTALTLTNLTAVNNGTVMLTGYDAKTNPVMLTMRIASVGNVASLDTTFNSQGTVPGVAPMQIENETANYYGRVATGVAIQSYSGANQGNLVFSAYESQTSSQSTPESFRLFGQPATRQVQRFPLQDQNPGTLDFTLNDCGALDISLLTSSGVAKVVYAYPVGNTHEGKILIGVDSGSTLSFIRVDETLTTLDVTFGTDGLYTIDSLTGLQNIMVDGQNRIVINGTTTFPSAWVQRIPENGDDVPTVFNMPADIISVNMVYQQKSGRYIVAGATSIVGTMVAFQDEYVWPATGLAVDLTFNPLSTGSSIAGRWNIAGSTSLYSLAINFDDTIYTAYQDTSSGFLTIAQVLANGAGLDSAFNSTGLLATPITPDNASVIRLAVNANQDVIVAASCSAGTSLQAFRCNSTGGTGSEFFGSGVSAGVLSTTLASSTGITLQALLEDMNGKTILMGSTTDNSEFDENGTLFAVRLSVNGPLDPTWNPSPTSPDVPGILTFGAAGNPLDQAITIMSNATINIPGNIIAVGGDGTDPILMEIVGDSFVTGVQQGQLEVAAGILDLTLFETTGSLNLVASRLVVFGYTPEKLYIYPNGSMLMGASNGAFTTLTKVDATLAFDSTFNSGAIVPLGAGTASLFDMFVANATGQDGTIYVSGQNSSDALWSGSITPDGLHFTMNAPIPGWQIGTSIRLAGDGDMIVAGFDGTHGAVAAFLPNGAALDTFFGTDGVYATNSNFPIAAMTIDSLSRIYIAYVDSSIGGNPITVQRLNPNGTLDTTFAAVPIPGSWSSYQIKLSLDELNSQLVVAAQNGAGLGNILQVNRFDTWGGYSTGVNAEITLEDTSLSLSDLFIDTNQEVYVVGVNTTDAQAIVARLTSFFVLDANYAEAIAPAPAGVANLAIPSMTNINAGGLDPDRRVYLFGNDGTGTAYMARVFGNNYYTQVSQAASSAILGELDYSYGYAGVATNYAGTIYSPSSNQEARAILPLATGSDSLTIIGDGVYSWTVQLLSNGYNSPLYNGGQGIQIAQQASGDEIVEGMVFDSSGNAIVFGSNSVAGGYVKSVLPSGSMNPAFGGGNGYVYISQFDVINAVAQLSNGNFVIVGYKGSARKVGKVGMIQQDGAFISVITAGIDATSVSVDSLDNIYVSLTTTSSSIISASVAKYDATGVSPLFDLSYGVNGIASDIMTNLDAAANVRLVLDRSGKVVIAASGNGEAGSVGLRRLNFDGSIDASFNAGVQLNIPFASGTSAVVTGLSALLNGCTLVAGYQYDPIDADNNDYEFVASVTSAGILDVNFNSIGEVPGLLTFQVAQGDQTGRNVWGMGVQHDGQILLAGSEGPEDGGEIPLTMRINGYPGVTSVRQFTGPVVVVPSDINPTFGIQFTMPAMLNLVEGGYTAVDSQNRVLVGGRTAGPNTFVVARFLTDGSLDSTFGTAGIAQTPELPTLLSGSFITLDGSDNVYIGGVTTDAAFIVAKFLSGNDGLHDGGDLDVTFNSDAVSPLVPGVAQSLTTANVVVGGYLTIDYIENVIVGGMTADQKLSVARFTAAGLPDDTFGTGGVAQTPTISHLNYGGYVATAIAAPEIFPDLNDNSIYVGASTYDSTLIVAKFDRYGVIEPTHTGPGVGFGENGIAQTVIIPNYLVTGGSLSLDQNRSIAIGGYTYDQKFVAAKFLPSGASDPLFSTDGVAFSAPLIQISSFGDLAIDSNNNILLGGVATGYDLTQSMVVARLTPLGGIDTSFGTNGISTSGVIPNLASGGFVSVNILNNVFVGGYNGTQLVVAGLYSGYEFFIDNPGSLPELAKRIFLYGNDHSRFKKMLGIYTFVEHITDPTRQASALAAISASLDAYAQAATGQLGLNLAASLLTIWSLQLTRLEAALILAGDSDIQVHLVFDSLRARAIYLNKALGVQSIPLRP